MKWKKFSLPHVLYDLYCNNTKKNHNGNRFSGSSYFLAHVSNDGDLALSVALASLIISIPALFLCPIVIYPAIIIIVWLVMVGIISLMDTYSARKYRIRANMMKTVNCVLTGKKKGNLW